VQRAEAIGLLYRSGPRIEASTSTAAGRSPCRVPHEAGSLDRNWHRRTSPPFGGRNPAPTIANARGVGLGAGKPARTVVGIRHALGRRGGCSSSPALLVAPSAAVDDLSRPVGNRRSIGRCRTGSSRFRAVVSTPQVELVPGCHAACCCSASPPWPPPTIGRTPTDAEASAARTASCFLRSRFQALSTQSASGLIGRARRPSTQTGPFDFAPFSGGWNTQHAVGHATDGIRCAIAIGAIFPRARLVMWVYAGLVALSRVVLVGALPERRDRGAGVGSWAPLLCAGGSRRAGSALAIGADAPSHAPGAVARPRSKGLPSAFSAIRRPVPCR